MCLCTVVGLYLEMVTGVSGQKIDLNSREANFIMAKVSEPQYDGRPKYFSFESPHRLVKLHSNSVKLT